MEQKVHGGGNGIKEGGESGKDSVRVRLYDETGNHIKIKGKDYVETDPYGKYSFEYVQVGPRYYVEFEYDWMEYKATEALVGGSLGDFRDNPENYINASHASEKLIDRNNFNKKYVEITTDKGYSDSGAQTSIEYSYENFNDPYYQVATAGDDFGKVLTKNSGILLPLQTKFAIAEYDGSGEKFLTVGIGEKGSCAITSIFNEAEDEEEDEDDDDDKDAKSPYLFEAGQYMKVQTYLKNINLGLVERCPADFAVKTDILTTTFTLNEDFSNQNVEFNSRANITEDSRNSKRYITTVNRRNNDYVYERKDQNITEEEYNWRYDFTEFEDGQQIATEDDELQLYVLYEHIIKNESPLISGYITELSNYYDNEYYYPVGNDSVSINFYPENSGSVYKDKAMQFMKYPSYYIIRDSGNNETIGQVNWKATSKFDGERNGTSLNKMYTESLSGILLAPGQEISVYVYYKVNREESNINSETEYKYGDYIIKDNNTGGKWNVTEINAYKALDYYYEGGSRVDIDSNPGNLDSRGNVSTHNTHEDDTEAAPLLRVKVNGSNGKEISGYVWEDLRTEAYGIKLGNNQWIGNGKREKGEQLINNVGVQLIRLEYNPGSGKYEEVKFSEKYERYIGAINNNPDEEYGKQYENGEISLIKIKRRTGPQDEVESLVGAEASIDDGQYKFINLIESGQYKVRFTYGDEEQLISSNVGITYNGHDYKSTEFTGFYNQGFGQTELDNMAVPLEESAEIKILTTSSNYQEYVNGLETRLRDTYNDSGSFSIATRDIGGDIAGLNQVINELSTSTKNAKVLVLLADKNISNAQESLQNALSNDIEVIIVGTKYVDGKGYATTAGDNSVIYFDTLDSTLSLINVYNRIVNSVLEDNIFVTTYNQATDFIKSGKVIRGDSDYNNLNGEVHGRIDVMKLSQTIGHGENATDPRDLEVEKIKDINNSVEKLKAIRTLSEYKMSAESHPVSITFDDNDNVKSINLGLQRIPKSSLELSKKVDNIIVRDGSGKEIINWKNQKRENVQHFVNESYNIYMDEDIMQGAQVFVDYAINITNTGEVDNLITYLKYYSDAVKKAMYEELGGNTEGLSPEQIEEKLYSTITVKVNKIYDYYDNMGFRAQDNSRNVILRNFVEYTSLPDKYGVIQRDGDDIVFETDETGAIRGESFDSLAAWSEVQDSSNYQILDENKDKINKDKMNGYKCIETSSTNTTELELYPFENFEGGTSSISVYAYFGKELAANDFNFMGALEYRNFAEIIETYSISGRRDVQSSVGNFIPEKFEDENITDEADSDNAEVVKILVPFGPERYIKYGLGLLVLITIGGTVIILRRKQKRKNL